jgi:hypothetical protein
MRKNMCQHNNIPQNRNEIRHSCWVAYGVKIITGHPLVPNQPIKHVQWTLSLGEKGGRIVRLTIETLTSLS